MCCARAAPPPARGAPQTGQQGSSDGPSPDLEGLDIEPPPLPLPLRLALLLTLTLTR